MSLKNGTYQKVFMYTVHSIVQINYLLICGTGLFFRSITVKMMLNADVSYNLFILAKDLILPIAKERVTIVPRTEALLRRMSLRRQSNWFVIILVSLVNSSRSIIYFACLV